jgi:hypothetical protein
MQRSSDVTEARSGQSRRTCRMPASTDGHCSGTSICAARAMSGPAWKTGAMEGICLTRRSLAGGTAPPPWPILPSCYSEWKGLVSRLLRCVHTSRELVSAVLRRRGVEGTSGQSPEERGGMGCGHVAHVRRLLSNMYILLPDGEVGQVEIGAVGQKGTEGCREGLRHVARHDWRIGELEDCRTGRGRRASHVEAWSRA